MIGRGVLCVCVLLSAPLVAQQRDPRTILTEIEALHAELRKALDPPTVSVPATGDLQAALDTAPAGARVELERGGVYRGPFVIRRSLTLTTAGVALGDRRATPLDRELASLVSPDASPALEIAPGTTTVTIRQIHAQGPSNDIVLCGRADGQQTTRAQQPRGIVFDQVVIEGDPTKGAKRGIAANCADLTVTRSTIRGIWRFGQDSQAIAGWNGEGPFRIVNNYLEAASENILFGGGSVIPGLIPSDILIDSNYLTKDLAWQAQDVNVKNLFELKGARRVTVRGNIFEYTWTDAQVSRAIVLTPSQAGVQGTTPADCVIEDILIEQNIIRHVGGGISLLGASQHPEYPCLPTARVTIRENWFQIDHVRWGGYGAVLMLDRAPTAVAFDANTVEQTGTRFLIGVGAPAVGFRLVGNLVKPAGKYGMTVTDASGQNQHFGRRWRDYFPDGLLEGNAIADFPSPSNLPNNLHVTSAEAEIVDGRGVNLVAGYGRR